VEEELGGRDGGEAGGKAGREYLFKSYGGGEECK